MCMYVCIYIYININNYIYIYKYIYTKKYVKYIQKGIIKNKIYKNSSYHPCILYKNTFNLTHDNTVIATIKNSQLS